MASLDKDIIFLNTPLRKVEKVKIRQQSLFVGLFSLLHLLLFFFQLLSTITTTTTTTTTPHIRLRTFCIASQSHLPGYYSVMTTQHQSQTNSSTGPSTSIKTSPSSGDPDPQDAEMPDVRSTFTPESMEDGRSETAPSTAPTGENSSGISLPYVFIQRRLFKRSEVIDDAQ